MVKGWCRVRRWTRSNGPGEAYIHVGSKSVTVGEHHGSGRTDNAGVCSHAEFLHGKFQSLVLKTHGPETLAEVIAAVKAAE